MVEKYRIKYYITTPDEAFFSEELASVSDRKNVHITHHHPLEVEVKRNASSDRKCSNSSLHHHKITYWKEENFFWFGKYQSSVLEFVSRGTT
jgi:hypothetical protein